MATGDVVISCRDLDAALAFYTDELGFRLASIFPADAPRVATLRGFDITVRLERDGPAPEAVPGEWNVGRAGMHYRDLVPGRLDGHVIASHIRIPVGGPVPDYVHYHKVRFQLIYCLAGWVRVVYQDQGPAFVLEPGDCVLQAPQIRHRVLESSDDLEVIEVGCPAEHETLVDHELALPTDTLRCDRDFGGQRFVRHVARLATWSTWRCAELEARDTGIAAASNGIADVQVVRSSGPAQLELAELELAVVLNGPRTGECIVGASTIAITDGVELLYVRLPPR